VSSERATRAPTSQTPDARELSQNDLDRVAGGVGTPLDVEDFSFSVENPTTIGSQTGGAGAGKIKFNEFQITRTTDKSSPSF
jgi:hypothetical protein